jgi:3-oxoacyl-[acyl-carrier protein] reductase
LAEEGTSLIINYRNYPDKANNLLSKLKETYGIQAIAVKGDISVETDVKQMFAEAEEKLAVPDILINNAGICPSAFIKDMDFDTWKQTMDVNLNGVFLTSRSMVNALIDANKKGKIVNITSQAAFNGSVTGKSNYSASKGGVTTFTISLAKEVAQYGINVNAVAPGMLLTEMTRETLAKNADKYNKTIPLQRIAEVEEVARVVTFLSSIGGDYITGTTVHVSGGMCMR